MPIKLNMKHTQNNFIKMKGISIKYGLDPYFFLKKKELKENSRFQSINIYLPKYLLDKITNTFEQNIYLL